MLIFIIMKYLFLLFTGICFTLSSNCQPLLYANFNDFLEGDLNGQNGWTHNSSYAGGLGACAGALCLNNAIVSQTLNYPSFDSCNYSLELVTNQDGIGTSFNSVTTGSVYVFILCQFSAASGTSNDFLRLMGGSNYSSSCKLYIKDAGGGFYAGVGKGTTPGVYNGSGGTFLSYNVPHLLVIKYTFKTATTSDDVVTLYVDPDMTKAEPTAHEILTAGGTDASSVDRLCFPYNASNKPTGYVGVVKASATWTDGFKIAGKCITPSGQSVNAAVISATGVTTSANTDTAGMFNYYLQAGNYNLKATKNNDVNKSNGVTSIDLALIQSHILGKLLLNSPYKIIAADVNGDGNLTALDIVNIKRLILGIDTTFNNTITNQKRLWVFVDSSKTISSLTTPFIIKDSISITNLNANQINQTFTGIKLGDVNWDWSPLLPRQNPAVKQGKKEEEIKY